MIYDEQSFINGLICGLLLRAGKLTDKPIEPDAPDTPDSPQFEGVLLITTDGLSLKTSKGLYLTAERGI